MTDPTAKYIVLSLVPLIVTIILIILAYLVVRFNLEIVVNSINFAFWELRDCFVYGIARGKLLGVRLFIKKESIYYVNLFLLYGAANAAGLIFTIWWRIVLFDIVTDTKCVTDLDCFRTSTTTLVGFPQYEPCENSTKTFPDDIVLFCLRFSIPTIDALFVRVGIAYGFTTIVFSIIRFIMKFNGGQRINKIISIVAVVFLVVIVILLILLLALAKSFSAWLTKSLINYLIPFMIVLCVIVAFILFGLMNRKLTNCRDSFDDGDSVYYIHEKS